MKNIDLLLLKQLINDAIEECSDTDILDLIYKLIIAESRAD